jgi:hypothetical protein
MYDKDEVWGPEPIYKEVEALYRSASVTGTGNIREGNSPMNMISRLLVGAGLFVLLVVVALGAGLVLANLNDEPLNPDIERILSESHPQITTDENGYFALIGVNGPMDMDPHEWGLAWHEAAVKADSEGSGGSDMLLEQESRALSLGKDVPCGKIESCLDAVMARPEVARSQLDQAADMLKRCDVALNYRYYQEPWRRHMSLASPLPFYGSSCRDLQSISFAFSVAEHQDTVAIEYLRKLVKFHTLQVEGSVTLLSKVVAMSYLMRDYKLLNQYLLLRPDESRQHALAIRNMLLPLSDKGRSMQEVWKREFTLAARGFLDLQKLAESAEDESDNENDVLVTYDETLTDWFYLPNATVNEYYRDFRPLLSLEETSGQAYREMFAVLEREGQDENAESRSLYKLRNPVGHILLQIGQSSLLPYLGVRDNMLALRALVAFQFKLLERGIKDSTAIAQAVSQSQLFHRQSGEAAIWNQVDRTLLFSQGVGEGGDSLAIRL